MVQIQNYLADIPSTYHSARRGVLADGQLNYAFLSRQDGFFVKVRVSHVGRHRQFPLASVVNPETGTRDWTNDLGGKELFVDKTTLEDVIRFQDVRFGSSKGINSIKAEAIS